MGHVTPMAGRGCRIRAEETDLVDLGDMCLHYRDLGDRTAPVALVLHGLMGHGWEWDTLTSRLSRSHRVIAPDQRGHGFSEWSSDYSVDAFAADAIELLDHLGAKDVRLIGSSVGGLAGMLVAARRPDLVARLVLVDVGPDSFASPAVALLRARLLARTGEAHRSVDEAVARWTDADPSLQHDAVRAFLQRSFARDPADQLVWSFDGVGLEALFVDGVSSPTQWGAIDDLLAPTLLIRGDVSSVMTRPMADQMADRLLHFDGLVEIGGAAHDLALQAPIAVAHHFCEYLERADP